VIKINELKILKSKRGMLKNSYYGGPNWLGPYMLVQIAEKYCFLRVAFNLM